MARIRVVLAEDDRLLREGISRLVETHEEFDLVGVAPDLPQLLGLVESQSPDVVITDIRMPPTGTREGIEVATTKELDRQQKAGVPIRRWRGLGGPTRRWSPPPTAPGP